jgi:chemotaxis protein MotB
MMEKSSQSDKVFEQQKQLENQTQQRVYSWQIIYIGLFTAILAFFILILSLADLEPNTAKRNFQKLTHALYVTTQQAVKQQGVGWIQVENTLSHGIKLTLNPKLFKNHPLFNSAKAQINPRFVPYLNGVANLIQSVGIPTFTTRYKKWVKQIESLGYDFVMTIRIEGYTDAQPLAKLSRFKTNIELSTFRAYAVMDFLRIHTQLPSYYFSIAGYGSFKPLVSDPNSPLNRRIEIYLEPKMVPKGQLYVK